MTQLAMTTWKRYANLVLDKVKYVGIGAVGSNKAHTSNMWNDKNAFLATKITPRKRTFLP